MTYRKISAHIRYYNLMLVYVFLVFHLYQQVRNYMYRGDDVIAIQ